MGVLIPGKNSPGELFTVIDTFHRMGVTCRAVTPPDIEQVEMLPSNLPLVVLREVSKVPGGIFPGEVSAVVYLCSPCLMLCVLPPMLL